VSTPAPEAAAAPPVTPKAPAAPPAAPAGGGAKPDTTTAPASGDKPLGPNGEKALQAERDARKELEKKLTALAPLEKLAAALGGGDPAKAKSEIELLTERQTQFEQEVAKEREARWRAEVANEKGLTPTQAGRLRGATRDELVADADAMIADFGITPGKPATGSPRPDPSQGARPGGEPDIDQQIREAESKGDVREAIRLKTHKSMQPAK
jgi:hypothetical protein